jgi:hypothetical protein
MAISSYDYDALATKYDRIMNASKGSMQKNSHQAEIVADIVKKIEQIAGSHQYQIRIDFSHFAATDLNLNLRRMNSVSSHLLPGEISWADRLGTQIDVDRSASNLFFNFFMKTGQLQDETRLVDDRECMKFTVAS